MSEDINKWLKDVRDAGFTNVQIKEQLKARGYSDEQIVSMLNHDIEGVQKKFRGKDILDSDKKLQLYQKIITGWLGVYLLLRLIIGILVTSGASSSFVIVFWTVYGLFFVLPGVIIFIGLMKVKVWAYFLYMVALFSTIIPNNIPDETVPFIIVIFSSIGSLIIFILTIILYNKLFPSRKSFKNYKEE